MPTSAPLAPDPLHLLAGNLQALRAKGNWSTRALAEHAKVGRRTIQRIEQLEFDTVTLDTVDRLARGLGVRTGSLLGRRPLARRDSERLVEELLAENLVRARERRGLTLQALGELSGVNMFVIAHIERQARSPDIATLGRLAFAMRVSVERLLSEPRVAPGRGPEPATRPPD